MTNEIYDAIDRGDLEFLKTRSDIGEIAADSRNISRSFVCYQNSRYDVAKLFLHNGGDPNITWGEDCRKISALMFVIRFRGGEHIDMAKKLIEFGADINYNNGVTATSKFYTHTNAIRCAITSGMRENVELLLDNGAFINDDDLFANFMNAEVLDSLISGGANLDAVRQYDGMKFLNFCFTEMLDEMYFRCKGEYEDMVKMLLDNGADPTGIQVNDSNQVVIEILKKYRRPPFHPRMLRKVERSQIFTMFCIREIDSVDLDSRHFLGVLPYELLMYIVEELVGMM